METTKRWGLFFQSIGEIGEIGGSPTCRFQAQSFFRIAVPAGAADKGAVSSYQNYIGGQWSAAASGRTFETRNPADAREIVATYPLSGAPEAAAAIAAAQEAFPKWAAQTAVSRGDSSAHLIAFALNFRGRRAQPAQHDFRQRKRDFRFGRKGSWTH